jgi:hypothetical protein
MQDGRSVALSCSGYSWRFFIQRHRPFKDDRDRAAFLVRLIKSLKLVGGQRKFGNHVTVPKAKDPTQSETRFLSSALFRELPNGTSPITFASWRPADGEYRTMYGWTPPEERLSNGSYLHSLPPSLPPTLRYLLNFV